MAHLFSQRARRQRARWRSGTTSRIMFEALFILTTLDAGTRVGRFMLQDLGKHVWAPFGRTSWMPGGRALERDVRRDVGPLPLSGRDRSARRHQLAVAAVRHREPAARRRSRCASATTVIIKMGKARYAWVTLLPLAWLVDRDDDRRLHEDLLAASAARLPRARARAAGGAGRRHAAAGREERRRRSRR